MFRVGLGLERVGLCGGVVRVRLLGGGRLRLGL